MKPLATVPLAALFGPRGSGVYALRCSDGRLYVGRTRDLEFRRRHWLGECRIALHLDQPPGWLRPSAGPRLGKAFREMSEGEWEFFVLERCEPERLREREAFWQAELKPELNERRESA